MGHYPSHWQDVLNDAKTRFSAYLHQENPPWETFDNYGKFFTNMHTFENQENILLISTKFPLIYIKIRKYCKCKLMYVWSLNDESMREVEDTTVLKCAAEGNRFIGRVTSVDLMNINDIHQENLFGPVVRHRRYHTCRRILVPPQYCTLSLCASTIYHSVVQ